MNRYCKDTVVTTLAWMIGLAGISYAIGTHTKLAKISERLDKSINELADNMEIDIPDELIRKAVDKAVSEETKKAVTKATNDVVYEMRHDIRRTVASAVSAEYERVQESVLKEITNEAAKIDVTKVRRDVERAAEKAAIEKFDANLDNILNKFNADLDNTAKVYEAIKTMMTPNTNLNREFVLKLG